VAPELAARATRDHQARPECPEVTDTQAVMVMTESPERTVHRRLPSASKRRPLICARAKQAHQEKPAKEARRVRMDHPAQQAHRARRAKLVTMVCAEMAARLVVTASPDQRVMLAQTVALDPRSRDHLDPLEHLAKTVALASPETRVPPASLVRMVALANPVLLDQLVVTERMAARASPARRVHLARKAPAHTARRHVWRQATKLRPQHTEHTGQRALDPTLLVDISDQLLLHTRLGAHVTLVTGL